MRHFSDKKLEIISGTVNVVADNSVLHRAKGRLHLAISSCA